MATRPTKWKMESLPQDLPPLEVGDTVLLYRSLQAVVTRAWHIDEWGYVKAEAAHEDGRGTSYFDPDALRLVQRRLL